MPLEELYLAVADAYDGDLAIEKKAQAAMRDAAGHARFEGAATPLQTPFQDAMRKDDAHPVCQVILDMELPWAPPTTSNDPKYLRDNAPKMHVELLGPDGLVKSDTIRAGFYGILPNATYGVRSHLAEEVFVMIAGMALWKRGDGPYMPARSGERSYHPSMLGHGTQTTDEAFMSLYAWAGDVSTDSYVYSGRTDG